MTCACDSLRAPWTERVCAAVTDQSSNFWAGMAGRQTKQQLALRTTLAAGLLSMLVVLLARGGAAHMRTLRANGRAGADDAAEQQLPPGLEQLELPRGAHVRRHNPAATAPHPRCRILCGRRLRASVIRAARACGEEAAGGGRSSFW